MKNTRIRNISLSLILGCCAVSLASQHSLDKSHMKGCYKGLTVKDLENLRLARTSSQVNTDEALKAKDRLLRDVIALAVFAKKLTNLEYVMSLPERERAEMMQEADIRITAIEAEVRSFADKYLDQLNVTFTISPLVISIDPEAASGLWVFELDGFKAVLNQDWTQFVGILDPSSGKAYILKAGLPFDRYQICKVYFGKHFLKEMGMELSQMFHFLSLGAAKVIETKERNL